VDFTKRGYSTTWSIWNVDVETYDESIVDWAQSKWRSIAMVDADREMMDMLRSRQKRWLDHILRHDSLLRTTLEGRIQAGKGKTKNYVLGLVIEDGGRQQQLWWTKDVGTRQIKMVSVKMEICHTGRILQQQQHQRDRQTVRQIRWTPLVKNLMHQWRNLECDAVLDRQPV